MGVGNGVGVFVGGNQTIVGVDEAVGSVGVEVGCGVAVGEAVQAAHMITNRQYHISFFIIRFTLIMDYS